MTNVLVVGSGGREHALAWRVSQSDMVDTVYTAPGNGGTPDNIPIQPEDIGRLADFAAERGCFTIVGPEAPLAAGIVDAFTERGLDIFGPTQAAARLESSKAWAKGFMGRHRIRTARSAVFDDASKAAEYVDSVDYDVVIKADGLAAGKGVVVCGSVQEAKDAIRSIMEQERFGGAGRRIVIEERLSGVESSYIAMCDGRVAAPMATSQDHKRIYDNDEGPNTGGMGAYSPAPHVDADMADTIQSEIIDRTLSGMKEERCPLTGFLYAGIMIQDGTPYVLEYNVRMGDPECQPIVMRMDFDLYEYAAAAASGKLASMPPPRWRPEHAVCVVLAARGYPGAYPKGQPISIPHTDEHTTVFHAGTARRDGQLLSSGGRVLGVTSLGGTLRQAVERAYRAADGIGWSGKYCRRDIAAKAL
ncbi:MAG: phosphoribosylamine--glycine ligase [Nitrosopumilaceae archaeon]|nr:phosphoribosylamine--glycine ligase [Nitrosopumilaceae archaeon]